MSQMTANQLGFIEDSDGTIRIDDIVIPPAPVAAVTSECPESRLIIDTIIVNNFKSYGGTQKPLGPFNKNLTCIVGPNGSGKSNVIDSLLFVFGYRSKKIRSKKVSELIHNSDHFPNARSCKVTVNFAYIKDDETSEIIPGSRFAVSRTALRDESSYYELNSKRVQYKEIAALLKAHGIDLEHNRFLILQGEIEAISLMSPKGMTEHETGMLEYIEDVIGSNRLIEPIKRLEKKVEELADEYKINFEDLDKIEKERNMWEGPKSKAIEYLKLKNSICRIENSLYHFRRYETEKTLEGNCESKSKLVEEIKVFKTEWENLRSSKKALENSMSRVGSEYDGLQKAIEEKKEQFAKLELKDTANNDSLKTLRQKVKTLEHTLETSQNELTKINKQSTVYEQETNELQTRKKNLEEEKGIQEKEMNEVMASMKQEIDIKQKKKDSTEVELVQLKKKSCEIKSEMNSAQSKLNLLKSGGNKEQGKLKTLMSSHQKAVSAADNEEKFLKAEQDKKKSTEEEIEICSQQLKEAKLNEESLIKELGAIRTKLEEARLALSTSSHRNVMVQGFMKEKAKGRLTGVYGRLGDLGAIDEKYDVAISTVCGALDNIVTDTLSTAQECIDFLKKSNLGYTTFIAVDQMKQKWENKANTKISTPENVPRLFDLVQVKDKDLLPVFYYALQDTLVANNLDQASRIAYKSGKRYRVVTLTGQLCDTSGTMSGGGRRMMKGRMGQKVVESSTVTQEDVNKIQSDMDAINNKLSTIRKQKMNLEERISQKSSVISSLHHSLKKRMQNFNVSMFYFIQVVNGIEVYKSYTITLEYQVQNLY